MILYEKGVCGDLSGLVEFSVLSELYRIGGYVVNFLSRIIECSQQKNSKRYPFFHVFLLNNSNQSPCLLEIARMTEPTVRFVPVMTDEQREIYRELRQQQLEMTPFPDRPLVQPTQEEIERAHAEMTTPHSPSLLHPPPEPLPQPEPVRARRNSHPQLYDE